MYVNGNCIELKAVLLSFIRYIVLCSIFWGLRVILTKTNACYAEILGSHFLYPKNVCLFLSRVTKLARKKWLENREQIIDFRNKFNMILLRELGYDD